jgi:hypothetical protein
MQTSKTKRASSCHGTSLSGCNMPCMSFLSKLDVEDGIADEDGNSDREGIADGNGIADVDGHNDSDGS